MSPQSLRTLRFRSRIRPDSAAAAVATRGAMAAVLPALAARDDYRSAVIRRALRSAAMGRPAPDERVWLSRIEAWRRHLNREQRMAEMQQSGVILGHSPETLSRAVRWMSIPPVWGRFLMCVITELRPESCLELGTGFGISGAYQAAALELARLGRLITLDVPVDWTAIAERSFVELGLSGRVELHAGPLDETLAPAVEAAAPIDYAFFDADHGEEGTMEHFAAVVTALAPGAVVIFDDVRWSEGMRRAWGRIRSSERVTWSARLGRMGAVVVS